MIGKPDPRDNEVSPSHPLMRTLAALRSADAKVHEIVLAPLGLDDIGHLVADALHCDRERAAPLAQLLHDKTAGNPFFAIQFLTALAEEGLLAFEPGAAAWTWDLARICERGLTGDVANLMVGKLNRLPAAAREALKHLACLGNTAETATLSVVHGPRRPMSSSRTARRSLSSPSTFRPTDTANSSWRSPCSPCSRSSASWQTPARARAHPARVYALVFASATRARIAATFPRLLAEKRPPAPPVRTHDPAEGVPARAVDVVE